MTDCVIPKIAGLMAERLLAGKQDRQDVVRVGERGVDAQSRGLAERVVAGLVALEHAAIELVDAIGQCRVHAVLHRCRVIPASCRQWRCAYPALVTDLLACPCRKHATSLNALTPSAP
jgi:hypothetical protein